MFLSVCFFCFSYSVCEFVNLCLFLNLFVFERYFEVKCLFVLCISDYNFFLCVSVRSCEWV